MKEEMEDKYYIEIAYLKTGTSLSKTFDRESELLDAVIDIWSDLQRIIVANITEKGSDTTEENPECLTEVNCHNCGSKFYVPEKLKHRVYCCPYCGMMSINYRGD